MNTGRLSVLLGLVVLAVGTSTLAGWWLDIAVLKHVLPGAVSMKVNTALALCAAALSLLLQHRPGRHPVASASARMLALGVAAIGGLTALQYATGTSFGIDEFLLADDPAPLWTPYPGRMAVLSALAFVAVGGALYCMDMKGPWTFRAAELMAAPVLLLGTLDVLEYLLGLAEFFPRYAHTRMAVHTALAFMLLALGILLAREPSAAVLRIRQELAGTLERRVWASLLVAVTAILLAVVASLYATRDFSARAAEMERLQEGRRAVIHLLSSLQDLETGMRGFVITGSEVFLEPYSAALRRIDQDIGVVGALLATDAESAALVSRVGRTAGRMVAESTRLVALARAAGIEAARNDIALGNASRHMKDLRAAIAQLDRMQQRRIAGQVAGQRESRDRLFWVLSADLALALGFLVGMGYLIQREVLRRRCMEGDLRRGEKELAAILGSISDAVLAVDTRGRVTRMNPVAERLTGWTQSEARGLAVTGVLRLVAGDESAPPPDILGETLADGTVCPLEQEALLLTRAGTLCPVSVSAAPIIDGEGRLSGAVTTFRDATRERESRRLMSAFSSELEARVRERTEELQRYEHIVHSASDLLAFRDRDDRFVLVNEAYCRYFDLSVSEIVGRRSAELFSADEHRELVAPLGGRCLAGESVVSAGWMTYPGAGRRFMELRYDPYFDSDGRIQGMVVAARDMTERHEGEQRLRESEVRFKTVAELGSDLIFEASLDTGVVTWFGDVDRQLGLPPGRGPRTLRHWLGLVHPDDRQRVSEAVDAQMQDPASDFAEEYRMMMADGSTQRWQVRSRLVTHGTAGGHHWVGSVRDMSRQHAMESQLAQAQKMEAVGQLTGGVAHDFNNRLTAILGSLELLQRQFGDRPDAMRLVKLALRAVEGGASLTRQLLTFSRRQVLETTVIEVSASIQAMLPLFQQALGEDIDARFIEHEAPWQIRTDAGMFENALLNLALNARDAMPGGGSLIIETRNVVLEENYLQEHVYASPGEHVLVSVSDTGTGIPREALAHVLEPFFTTKEPGHGTGLGLSMVYGFMRQSGGHIEIYSEPGHGTTVKLYFPRHAVAAPGRADGEVLRSVGETRGGRILVVEDDESVRQLAATQLRELGYEVLEAESGPAALERAEQLGGLHLLFTDVIMPGGMTGVELAARLRSRWPELEVIFTSGYTQRKVQAQWAEHGPRDHWLPKPYSFTRLASMIGTILNRATAGQNVHGATG